ncbi:enoyl-CoA hydratase/isomerase family protein [Skermania sp. ID1734]|uniref:enoyl-CoA hydratase/isomerase family protein n=1 Tax=Skermania sp. ID1734 TaxID=2597516 RepID=UPI00117C18D7|nr:enoyl-CoA hydratase-related protein [Skermania sp. ID1734]TSE01044.1 enoyl-CoA hydratase/isomerase family protein [Skermania sp. ID1734]
MTSVADPSATEFVRIADGVLTIVVSTPAKGTSLDFTGINQATPMLADLDRSVGAILLVGTGKNFCAGGDVGAFGAAADRGAYLAQLATDLHAFLRGLAVAPAPVVAAVHGWAAGAGMSLVCAADVAIGGTSTKMRPAYPGIGLTPDGGMSWSLPRIVGTGRAAEILLTDAILDAEEAARLGILSRVVADDEVATQAAEVARSLASGPRRTYANIRSLLAASPTNSLAAQLDLETRTISAAADSATGREGVDAFLAKRRPDYTGLD